MFSRRPNLDFPRQVVSYYLLFCLVAVIWLAVGTVVTSRTVINSKTTDSCLSQLGKIAGEIEAELLEYGTGNLQKIVTRHKSEAGLLTCAIVGTDGNYLAHSSSELTGTPAEANRGSIHRWGNVTGIRYVDELGRTLREYHVPLATKEKRIGLLKIAMAEQSLWATMQETSQLAPFTVLVPLGLVMLGAVVLSRLASPMALVGQQLRHIASQPPGTEFSLDIIPARDGVALGWNRLAELVSHTRKESGGKSLGDRLADAIQTHRDSQLSEIFQNLSEGVALTDMEGRLLFANRAINLLLGEHNSQAEQFEAWFDRDDLHLEDRTVFDTTQSHRPAITYLERNGEHASRVIRVARQPIADGCIQGQLWSLRDITQQTLAEKTRDQFIDTATHELRTPLSNIKAYAETLVTCDEIDVEQQKEFCNTINSEVTRLARFVDDLLSISSMEVGSLTIDRQKVETARLFAEVIENVEPLMEHKRISFEVDLPEKMQDIHVDKDKVASVLVNLLGNAAKYTAPEGRVSMKVSLDDHLLQIALQDSGVGISPEELPRVFEKFFRSSDPRVRSETGTGLGLALAHEIISKHGGDITVESELNHGSTFLVTLPVGGVS